MSLQMTREERERFLADVHVGVISIQEDGRAPLTVPIWYLYEPGGHLVVVTGGRTRKGRLLEATGRFSLCAQTESPPYSYVTVEGPIVAKEPSDVEGTLRPLARRYLGEELGDRYVEGTSADRDSSVTYRMQPQHWLSVDYSKQFSTD